MKHRIVSILDADKAIGEALAELLGTYAILVSTYLEAQAFEQAICRRKPDGGCLLIDATLPDSGRFTLLQRIRKHGIDTPVLVMIPVGRDDIRCRALRHGATDVIEKQFMTRDLVGRILELLNGDVKPASASSATTGMEGYSNPG